MLQLNKKVEYALIAMLHLDSLPRGELASAKEVADLYTVPAELLGKVMQRLAKEGLVLSVHGARGGYRLSRPLEETTLGEVVEAIDGPVHFARCQEDPAACVQFDACNIREPVIRVQAQLTQFIHSVRLASFRQEPVTAGTGREATG